METEGKAGRQTYVTQAKSMPVNSLQGSAWKQDLIARIESAQFPTVTDVISHISAKATLSLLPGSLSGEEGRSRKGDG